MNNAEQAQAYFKEGFVCSQAIFATFGEKLGIDRETALKIAEPFGAGMSCMAETCGAVTGAFMVFGLKYGRVKAADDAAKEKARALARKFVSEFKALHGSIVCRELLGVDISTPEGMERVDKEGLCDTLCMGFIRDAAEIVEKMI